MIKPMIDQGCEFFAFDRQVVRYQIKITE
jgi:hypothetical protein